MAIVQNNPFPGVDYTQYRNWNQVVLPTGQIYYEIPGNPGYVFIPEASNASGKIVIRPNPKLSIEKQKEEADALKAAQKQDAFNRSPAGQLIPVAAGTGGLIAASYAMQPAADPLSKVLAARLLGEGGATAATSPAAAAAAQGAAASGELATPSIAGASRLTPAAEGIGITPYLGAAGAGLGAYGLYDAIQSDNEGQGALSGAALGGGLAAAAPLVGLGPVGWGTAALMAAGGALGGFGLTSLFGHKTTKQRTQENYGNLQQIGADNAGYQDLVSRGMNESLSGVDTWDLGQDKGQAPIDLITRSYGVLDTFGPEWANLTQAQREAVARKLVDSDLINSRKGDWLVTDKNKAREIKDSVLSGFNIGAAAQAAAQGASQSNAPVVPPFKGPVPAVALPPRSSTLSPGIGLNGQPIVPVRRPTFPQNRRDLEL